MPKAKFSAVKMSGAQVSHISLVERGANRIPFKVVKKEKQDMSAFESLDLGGLFSRRKAEKAAPQVVAVVTMKGEGFDSIKKQVEEAGFAVADVQEMEDGSMVFNQGEFSAKDSDTQVIRMNDNIALVMKGFSPYNMDVTADGMSFAEQCAAKGFYPGISTIMETLGDALRSSVQVAKTPAEAKASASKLFSEASAYAASFVSGLPQKAFKLETIAPEIPAAEGSAATAAEGTTTEGTGTEGQGEQAAVTKAEGEQPNTGTQTAAETGTSSEPVEKSPKEDEMGPDGKKKKKCEEGASETSAETAPEPLTHEKVSDIVSSQVEEQVKKAMSGVESALAGVTEAFQSIQKSMTEMKGSVDGVVSRVDAVETVAKAAKEAVAGVVLSGAETGDAIPAQAKKSEMGVFGGREIDTAYMGNVRKRASR